MMMKYIYAQASAEGDVQGVMTSASASTSCWFMAHMPPLLLAHPRGAKTLSRRLPAHGGDQVSFKPSLIDVSLYFVDTVSAWAPNMMHSLAVSMTALLGDGYYLRIVEPAGMHTYTTTLWWGRGIALP